MLQTSLQETSKLKERKCAKQKKFTATKYFAANVSSRLIDLQFSQPFFLLDESSHIIITSFNSSTQFKCVKHDSYFKKSLFF